MRGNDISMIFQEPMTSLNPVLTIGKQIGEALTLHQTCHAARRTNKAVEMLRAGGHPRPEQRAKDTRTSSPAACASAS